MSSIIQPNYGARAYSAPTKTRETKQTGTQSSSFFDIAAQIGRSTADVSEIGGIPEASKTAETSNVDAYMEHLNRKYGRVTIESVGKDQASLEKAGKRMSGNDVVIAPNILNEMASDPKKAAYYEQKIDYFFTDVIPNGKAFAASRGLTFEPCGVVVHEDGTVTYICGGGDSPERVAEVNKINAEKAKKKAEQRRQYLELSAAAAAQRRAMWERAAEKAAMEEPFADAGGLLKAWMTSASAIASGASLPVGTNMFLLNM